MTHTRRCPVCLSPDIFRSKRRSREWMLLLPRPYHCNDCNRRFLLGVRKGQPLLIDISGGRFDAHHLTIGYEPNIRPGRDPINAAPQLAAN
jgi:hypothetical protein